MEKKYFIAISVFLLIIFLLMGCANNIGEPPVVLPPQEDDSQEKPYEVWVDDDYCDTCDNNGHFWGIDAFKTITEGINHVEEGGIVHVAPGLYVNDIWDFDVDTPEKNKINKTITLLGPQAGNDPNGSLGRGEEAVLVRTNGESYFIDAHDVVMDGFTFTSISSGNDSGTGPIVIMNNTEGAIIKNTIIKDFSGDAAFGIVVKEDARDVFISNNTLSNTGNVALSINGEAHVNNNTIKNIPLIGGIRVNSNNAIIENNEILKPFSFGIEACGNVKIINNLISECLTGLSLFGHDSEFYISGNQIQFNVLHGIEISNYSDNEVVKSVEITDNTIMFNKNCGIRIGKYSDGLDYFINDNKIFGNDNYGIRSYTTDAVDASENWWGAPSGPEHANNPNGTGDKVSDNVSYYPWYTDEELNNLFIIINPNW
jgi:hypothetical protein